MIGPKVSLAIIHKVRSLADSRAKKAQESKEAIQKNKAHRSVDTQSIYLSRGA